MHAVLLADIKAYLCYHDLPGHDPVCVWIHGLGGASSEYFPEVVAHPALAGRRAILVDLLGFGYSDRPAHFGYSIEEHADSVAALLDQLGLRDCSVVGHSMGGAVAIMLAARHPQLVGSLVLAEGNLDPGRGLASVRIATYSEEAYLAEGHAAVTAMIAPTAATAGIHNSIRLADPRATYRTARSLSGERQPTFREWLLGLTIPRTYLIGARSQLDEDRERLPAARVSVLLVPDAGHMMSADNLDGFARTVAQALRPA